MQTWSEMKNLVGHHVTVHLDESSSPDAKITGWLMDLTDEGEVAVRTADGMMFGWPAIRIERALLENGEDERETEADSGAAG